MGQNRKSCMLAKAREKYGKPNYPGRSVGEQSEEKGIDEKISEKPIVFDTYENSNEIWDKIKSILLEELSFVAYETWIEPCELISITDSKMVLSVENLFFKEMIEKRYSSILRRAAEDVTDRHPIEVEVIILK